MHMCMLHISIHDMCIYTYRHMYMYTYVHMDVNASHIRVHIHLHVLYTYIYLHKYKFIYLHIYIYTYTWTLVGLPCHSDGQQRLRVSCLGGLPEFLELRLLFQESKPRGSKYPTLEDPGPRNHILNGI